MHKFNFYFPRLANIAALKMKFYNMEGFGRVYLLQPMLLGFALLP